LSQTSGKTWSNPFHPELVYSVPDQVEVVARTSSGSTANLYTTSTDYANTLSRGAGLDAGFGAVFSGSAEVSHAKTFLSNGDSVLSVTQETVKLNSLSLLPPQMLKISDSLANAISQHLPLAYDERSYATFVSYFGSHYVTSAEYGGKATMMSSVKRDYLGSNSALVANANARVHFQQLKGGDIGASFSHSSASNDYTQACSDSWSVEMVGGNAHLNMSQWSAWTDSVKLAPAQISFRVVPLDRLMPDPQRAANFRKYLDTYFAQNNKHRSGGAAAAAAPHAVPVLVVSVRRHAAVAEPPADRPREAVGRPRWRHAPDVRAVLHDRGQVWQRPHQQRQGAVLPPHAHQHGAAGRERAPHR
jgi:hypothetical protein